MQLYLLQLIDTSFTVNDTSGYHPQRDMSDDLKKVLTKIDGTRVSLKFLLIPAWTKTQVLPTHELQQCFPINPQEEIRNMDEREFSKAA